MVLLETNYLRMYSTDLHQFLVAVHIWVGMINLTFFSRSLEGCCYGNRFLVLICEICIPNLHSVL